MSTTLQLIAVGLIVAFATLYVLRATWKTLFGTAKPKCASGCGKCATPVPELPANGRKPLPMA